MSLGFSKSKSWAESCECPANFGAGDKIDTQMLPNQVTLTKKWRRLRRLTEEVPKDCGWHRRQHWAARQALTRCNTVNAPRPPMHYS